MELPNPDPADAAARPHHGGRDRHFCIGVAAIEPLLAKLEAAGVPHTKSASGRPAVFFRDPDAHVIECVEGADPWR
jgi:glyoxylase I family protein